MPEYSLRSSQVGLALLLSCAAVGLLTLYCQITPGSDDVPLAVSLRWAMITYASWGIFSLVVWRIRHRLLALVSSGGPRGVLLAGGTLLVLAATTVLAGYAAVLAFHDFAAPISRFSDRLIEMAPNLLLLSGGVTALLAARSQLRAPKGTGRSSSLVARDWIGFPQNPRLRVRAADIATVHAAGNYCAFEVGGREHLLRATAQAMEEHLSDHGFIRISRSTIVNVRRVRLAAKADAGRLRLELDDGGTVLVSKNYRAEVEEHFLAVGPESALADPPRPS